MSAIDDARAAFLRTCHLSSGLAPDSLAPLVRASSTRVTERGAGIFAAGDAVDGLRVVVSGQVRLWIADREGRELTLLFAEPGDFFGEIALFDGLPRSDFVTASETTRCLFLPAIGRGSACRGSRIRAALHSDALQDLAPQRRNHQRVHVFRAECAACVAALRTRP